MYRRNDPRLRRTINQFTQNLESANEQAQEGIYDFAQRYINPCFGAVAGCLRSCVEPCFPSEDEQRRKRQRGRSQGRAELSFDFYDDWDDEQDDLVGWGNDELDHLLGDSNNAQPSRERVMSYGARSDGPQRRRTSVSHEPGADPTVIPKSSYFGFLERVPWPRLHRGLRYQPSAADLQDNPGRRKNYNLHGEVVEEETSDNETGYRSTGKNRRNRRNTGNSGHTTDSLSSRGDIFPSEDELDDAVPIDDEFAFALERRSTGMGEDGNSGKSKSGSRKASSRSRASMRTVSSKSVHSMVPEITPEETEEPEVPTLSELKAEEDAVKAEEEGMVESRRDAARNLAIQRGLSSTTISDISQLAKGGYKSVTPQRPLSVKSTETTPFPSFDPSRRASLPLSTRSANEEQSAASGPEPSTDLSQPDPSESVFVPAALPHFKQDPG